MKILIAEDDENSRVLLESSLEANGYEVSSAENGKIALCMARDILPDMIISDILMPEMDGYALCRAVKTDEKLCSIPFVFYTATYTDPADEKLAMDLGASRFIVKPVEITVFIDEIQAILKPHEVDRLPNPKHPLKEQHELETDYSSALTRKLDKKVRQLEDEKERLIESEEKYRRLVEVLRDDYFFYTHDKDSFFSYVSPSIINVLGYTPSEFITHLSDYMTAEPVNIDVTLYMEQSRRGIKQPPFEIEMYHKDGSIHRIELSEFPVIDKYGQVVSVEGIAHDITKRLSMENQLAKAQKYLQQAQKMESIGNLAGGIAHDFNNILTSIIGVSELLLDDLQPGSLEQENVFEIIKAGRRGSDLVKQILAFSRQPEQQKIPVRIQQVLKEVLQLCRSTIPSNIELINDIQTDCGFVLADPTQLHQIAMNLITNAYHAVGQTGGKISTQLKEIVLSADEVIIHSLEPGNYALLSVSDNGCGIKPAHLEKIFEPYFTTKEKGKGTGLGLAVVYGLVKNHGGNIKVYSEEKQGSTFSVYLPVIDNPTGNEITEHAETHQTGCERILLVDDEGTIVRFEKLMLERLGYNVSAFVSSIDALETFISSPDEFDLVITDMSMPGVTGDQFAKKLNAIRKGIPVILCTGFSETINQEKAASLGIKGFLMKPIIRSELAKMVRKVLDEVQISTFD